MRSRLAHLVSSTPGVRLESFCSRTSHWRRHATPFERRGVRDVQLLPGALAGHKLGTMMAAVFGHAPLVHLIGSSEAVLAAGPATVGLAAASPIVWKHCPHSRVRRLSSQPTTGHSCTCAPGIAPYYLAGLAFLLGFALLAVLGAARVSVHRFVASARISSFSSRLLASRGKSS